MTGDEKLGSMDVRANAKRILFVLATVISRWSAPDGPGRHRRGNRRRANRDPDRNDDRHIVELYFTAPNGEGFLADRSIYTRVQR